jgi:D-arginine dehydrogenase
MVAIFIIGAGFGGAASAYFLSQIPGLKIRLVEREKTFGMQASGKNAAMLRQAVPDSQTARWIQETLRFLQDPPSEWRDIPLFQKTGSLLLGQRQKLNRLYENMEAVGGRSQWINSKILSTAAPPWLNGIFPAHEAVEGLYCPDDGVIRLKNFLGQLLASAEKRGVEIFYHNEVTEMSPSKNFWQIKHGSETFQAAAIINAAGAWCDPLIRMAGFTEKKLIPHRRHLFVSKGWKFSNQGLPFVWDVAREVYFRPEGEEVMLSPGDETIHPPVPPQRDPAAEALLRKKLGEAFPGLEVPTLDEGWSCLRTKSRDGIMSISQLNDIPGYFIVGGLGGHGVGASMGLGKALRRLVQGWLEGKKSSEVFRVTDFKKGGKNPALGNG